MAIYCVEISKNINLNFQIVISWRKNNFLLQKSKINFLSFAFKSRLKIRRECGYFNEFQFRSLKFNLREKFNGFLISSFI